MCKTFAFFKTFELKVAASIVAKSQRNSINEKKMYLSFFPVNNKDKRTKSNELILMSEWKIGRN